MRRRASNTVSSRAWLKPHKVSRSASWLRTAGLTVSQRDQEGGRPSSFRLRGNGTLRLRSDATGARFVSPTIVIGRCFEWESAGVKFAAFSGAVSRAVSRAEVTLPTIACPPWPTETCCTVTFCSPPVR